MSMKPLAKLLLAALLSSSWGAQAMMMTRQCNTSPTSQVSLVGMDDQLQSRIMAAVARPDLDADLYARLWQPVRATAQANAMGGMRRQSIILDMDPVQDVGEMIAAMRADPVIAALGITSIQMNGEDCSSMMMMPRYQDITEYRNTMLDHYFLSGSAQENAFIDSGGAGPGWVRTGEMFRTVAPSACYMSESVFRFYGAGPNSHFYTADPGECGGLRTHPSGWQAEGVGFGASQPVNGMCDSSQTPVYRLYNNRFMFNDSNHRYTVRTDIYRQMMGAGWIGEGVAFCIYH